MQTDMNSEVSTSLPQNDFGGGTGPVFNNKSKKKVGATAAIVVLALVAVGGIGFGIWALVSGDQKAEDLNNQISNLNAQLTERFEQIDQIGQDDSIVAVDTNISTDSNINTADYIYLGAWGIKLKIGDKIKPVGITFLTGRGGAEVVKLGVSSLDSFGDVSQNYYRDVDNYPGDFIARTKDSEYDPFGFGESIKPVYNDGEFNYFVYQPTGYKTEGIANPEAFLNAYNELFTILQNKDNYSRI